jgi:hypothetical protein
VRVQTGAVGGAEEGVELDAVEHRDAALERQVQRLAQRLERVVALGIGGLGAVRVVTDHQRRWRP